MTADRKMSQPGSMSKDEATELANAQIAGKGDLLFYCRYARQKIDRYIEASSDVTTLRTSGGASAEQMEAAEARKRHAKRYLDGAADLLCETLKRETK